MCVGWYVPSSRAKCPIRSLSSSRAKCPIRSLSSQFIQTTKCLFWRYNVWGGGLNQMSWKLAQMSFSDNRCPSSVCTLFSISSSPEPLGQFQPHLAQSILRRRGYAGERYESWAYCLFVFVFWGRGWLYTCMMVLPCKHKNRHQPQWNSTKRSKYRT